MLVSTKDTVDETCPDQVCSPEGMKAVRRGKTQLALNTVGFIVAGVGLGTGATLLFLSSDKKQKSSQDESRTSTDRGSSRASLHFLPGGAALSYTEAF
jgi:hypothetical protein